MPLPPKKLNNKHHLIAFMTLGGASRAEVAAALDMDPAYVSAITNSPMFKELMDELRAEMRAKTIGGVVDRIIQEGPASVEALVALRDHAESEQVRVTAAKDLLDRNPETAKVSREDRRSEIRVLVDSRAIQRIAGVLEEDGATVTAIAEPVPPPTIQPLEDVVAALLAQADE